MTTLPLPSDIKYQCFTPDIKKCFFYLELDLGCLITAKQKQNRQRHKSQPQLGTRIILPSFFPSFV